MLNILHNLYRRNTRLLVLILLVVTILCNGIAMAQAYSTSVNKDCCPEMMGHEMPAEAMQSNTNDCPDTISDCDDLCMARCLNANGLLSVVLTIAPSFIITTPLPRLAMAEHSLAEFVPSLRPPIYS